VSNIPHNLLRSASLLYLTFVIYGSLVPLEYQSMPLETAWRQFANIRFLNLGIGSRADWVANLLLFIPAAFLLNGAFWTQKKSTNLVISFLVLLFCIALTFGIEFTQVFFPQRTVSQNDLFAEAVGSLIGIFAWWRWGEKLSHFYRDWQNARGTVQLSEKLLWVYVVILIGYNVLPLDLTISPVEIYHKWSSGKVNFIPFGFYKPAPVELLYELMTDVIIWAPISLLFILAGKSVQMAWRRTFAIAVLLEFLQFFVYSRVSDITDLITALAGAWLGIAIARLVLRKQHVRLNTNTVSSILPWPILAALVFWSLVVLLIFWFPFNFDTSGQFLRPRLDSFFATPLRAYYYGTEFRAITEFLHKLGFFMPFGFMLAWLRLSHLTAYQSTWINRLMIALLLLPTVVIEFGQLALPGKSATITDVLLEWIGGSLGYLLGIKFLANFRTPASHQNIAAPQPAVAEPPVKNTMHLKLGDHSIFLIILLCLYLAIWLGASAGFVPYNLREVLSRYPTFISAAGFSLLLLSVFTPTVVLGIWNTHQKIKHLWKITGLLLAHATLVYVLLRLLVPLESLDDIVGYPVLDIGHELERYLRFVFLFGLISYSFAGAAAFLSALRSPDMQVFLHWLIPATLLLPVFHWVIFNQAATDNLTELMRDNGNLFTTLLLSAWLWLLALASTLLIRSLMGQVKKTLAAVFTLISTIPGYLLLVMATAADIYKYGNSFSALQFLLSPDRDHYLQGSSLIAAYAVVHIGIVLVGAFGQYPGWIWIRQQSTFRYYL
jgi:VanZ family protein